MKHTLKQTNMHPQRDSHLFNPTTDYSSFTVRLKQTLRLAELLTGNTAEAFLTLPVIMVFAVRPE